MGGPMISTSPFNAFLVFAFLFFLPLLSAVPDPFPDCSTQPHYFCGNLNISYPFFNHTDRPPPNFNHNNGPPPCHGGDIGVELIRCTNGSTPVLIYTGVENDDSTYEVQSINYTTNTILARDRRSTRDWVTDNDKCNALFNNYTMPPIFRFLSAQVISPSLTLKVCKSHPINGVLHEDCKVEAIPDVPDAPDAPAPAPGPSSHPSPYDCKLVRFPVDHVPSSTFRHGRVDPVSKLFTAGFRVRWSLPHLCHQCDIGTVCGRFHDQDNLSCVPKDDRRNHGNDDGWKIQRSTIRIGISAGVAAGILFSSLFFFVFYKCRVGYKLGRARTFSLKADLEKCSIQFGVPIFSCAELEEATNNFSSANELGDGGFATVYHGKLRNGRVVAIKRLYHNNNKHIERFMNEIEILIHLRHQNLVTLYGCTSCRSRELLLVYEFIPNGTVADHLHGERRQVGSLSWPIRMSIAVETAIALSYLHVSNIIHRDVKTSNILLDNHFHVKVADFGLCRLFPTDATHVSTAPQGTPGYVDPEYHRSYQLTEKSDVYSFGVVLIELISSKPAVDITRHRDEINLSNMAMNKIQSGALQELVDPCLGFESDCTTRRIITLVAELAFRCLQHERELRPSMEEVVEFLTTIGVDLEYKVDNIEVMDILASSDVKMLQNSSPPPASPDSGSADKLTSRTTVPNTSG